jgi:putative colanic acid biosysnthesis UDP-glucose lipid carrier transferase
MSTPVPVSANPAFARAAAPEAGTRAHAARCRAPQSKTKRIADIVGAGLGIAILLPFLGLIALLIALESRGPVIFRQRRSGLKGAVFTLYKFRTMTVMEDGADVTQARRGDCRMTRLGLLLRRASLDELPQLFNVLKGDMSLVGPRPHALAHDQYFAQMVPEYAQRFEAKPGMTGLAQVSGFRGEIRDIRHMHARVTQDLEYIRTWSLALDARILFLTVTAAPFHRSSY